jgi:hypothetical protein
MVSEFMPNGNVQEYIQRTPGVDRYLLVRLLLGSNENTNETNLEQATNICAGLAYLHEHPKRVVSAFVRIYLPH